MPYRETRNYGFNFILRQYARFPQWLPLPCHFEHGWTPLTYALPSDLKTDKPLMLVFNKHRKEAWEKASKIPVEIMGSPFIHYKNLRKITQDKAAKGTVAFPSHSTYDLKIRFNIEDYCNGLRSLPKQFHPITICLFWIDYIEKADIYRKLGFKVTTAGPKFTNSLDFVANFYEILRRHKYATSNEVGSYTFYAVDFGLPFFIRGEAPLLENEGARDANVSEKTYIDDFVIGKRAMDIFRTGPSEKISALQRQFVRNEMGIDDCLSPQAMNQLLWRLSKVNFFGLRAFLPFVTNSIMSVLVFNGPWVKSAISARNKVQKFLVPMSRRSKLEKIHSIMEWIKNTQPQRILFFIYHQAVIKFKSRGRLPEYKTLLKYFEGKSGLEIGGPTKFFARKGTLPLYSVAKRIDNVNHAPTTIWTGQIDEDYGYIVDQKLLGKQYILDATDLSALKSRAYDFVFSCDTLEHIANPLRAIYQWLRVLKPEGLIVIIVPRKSSNFDRFRKTVAIEHLISDYNKEIGEDDLSHLPEAIKFHDLDLDPLAGTKENFRKRSEQNIENRCLHHHVFDIDTMEKLFDYVGLNILKTMTIYTEYIIIGRKSKTKNELEKN